MTKKIWPRLASVLLIAPALWVSSRWSHAEESRISDPPHPTKVESSAYLQPVLAEILSKLSDPSLVDLSKDMILREEIMNMLSESLDDKGVQFLHSIAQQDPALSSAIAYRGLMTQLQTITRWTQIQMLASFVRDTSDTLAVKALVNCVAQNLSKPQPVESCRNPDSPPNGWTLVKKYFGIQDADLNKEYSVLTKHIASGHLAFVYTYVGDLRLREDRIKRVYCASTPTENACGGIVYQDLGTRFGNVKPGVESAVGSNCDAAAIPTQVRWNTGLPDSASIDVDRSSFVLAYKNSDLCGRLRNGLTAAALSHEVTYVLTILSGAESEPSSLVEERDAIRLVREDLERRYTYWMRNFQMQNMTYEAYVAQARNRMESDRAATAAVLLAGW